MLWIFGTTTKTRCKYRDLDLDYVFQHIFSQFFMLRSQDLCNRFLNLKIIKIHYSYHKMLGTKVSARIKQVNVLIVLACCSYFYEVVNT